jgi:hypothetical protein
MTTDGQWILYLSGQPAHAGAWKMRADGSQGTPLVDGVNLPDVSPDGVLFAAPTGAGQRTGRVLNVYRMSDGGKIADIGLKVTQTIAVGRPRWVNARELAYIDRDDEGNFGVMVRDITDKGAGPPRKLAGFDSLTPTESVSVTRDGSRAVLSVRNNVSSIAVAENVPGITVSKGQ